MAWRWKSPARAAGWLHYRANCLPPVKLLPFRILRGWRCNLRYRPWDPDPWFQPCSKCAQRRSMEGLSHAAFTNFGRRRSLRAVLRLVVSPIPILGTPASRRIRACTSRRHSRRWAGGRITSRSAALTVMQWWFKTWTLGHLHSAFSITGARILLVTSTTCGASASRTLRAPTWPAR